MTTNEKVKICFIAIMRCESKIVERCLNSLKPIIDYCVISDTGSTDNTVELIEKWLTNNNIPGAVYHDEWKHFGHNRTLSVQNGQDWLTKNNIDTKNTYFFTIDADMLLVIGSNFNKEKLRQHAPIKILKNRPNSFEFNMKY